MEPMTEEEMRDRIYELEEKCRVLWQLLHNANETLKYTSKWHSSTPLGRDIAEALA